MKIRIKFRKYGVMKFIGHLDIMRYFQKAIRRAGIDIAYSEGFNPHQIMSFAAPLGVGIISDGEYLDIEVHSTGSTEESIDALNAVMVEGMEITDYLLLPDHAKKSMAIVAAAEYDVYYKDRAEGTRPEETNPDRRQMQASCVTDRPDDAFSIDEIEPCIRSYYREQDEIFITKKTKKSERVINVKPHIHEFSRYLGTDEDKNPVFGFHLLLSAGSEENIKPELVLEDFSAFCGKRFHACDYQIRRNDVYALENDGFVPLSYFGEKIE